MAKAIAVNSRIEGDDFQNRIRTNSPNAWFIGENILKKFPGFTILKYSLAAAIEFGISLPHDFASIKEVYMFTSNSPLAIEIDANKIIAFMFLFANIDRVRAEELYLTDIFINVSLYIAFVPFVFPGSHSCVGLKRFDKMRLI